MLHDVQSKRSPFASFNVIEMIAMLVVMHDCGYSLEVPMLNPDPHGFSEPALDDDRGLWRRSRSSEYCDQTSVSTSGCYVLSRY